MKHRIARILLLLVGSTFVNVVVAWGTAFFYSPGTSVEDLMLMRDGEHAWTVSVPAHWPNFPDRVLDDRGRTWTLVRYANLVHDLDEENGTLTTVESFHIDLWTLGWPMRAVHGHYWNELVLDMRVQPAASSLRFEGHPPESIWRTGIPIRGLSYLPMTPVWPGFAINVLFYALLLWLLFFGPFAARRALCRKRRLCEKCAYPIGTSPICTECGAAVR